MVDGLQVPAPGKGATGEVTIPPKACRYLFVWNCFTPCTQWFFVGLTFII